MPSFGLDAHIPLSARLRRFADDLDADGQTTEAARVREALAEYRARLDGADPMGALLAVTALGPGAVGRPGVGPVGVGVQPVGV
ncbi:hypothetical protein [Rubrivirga marina]|uniref:Uncharacterized protein n=1 Tax=Rubrivirga marina TaxID=1196024 RepID=A0A271J1U4_9BACT|nr:hypothetical protein [Rubrivirga marina]PAP77228.1 hypothetical protein BSZ37_12685 [Rubrivirga marina]